MAERRTPREPGKPLNASTEETEGQIMSIHPEENSFEEVAVPIGGPVPVGTVVMYAGIMNSDTVIKLGKLGWLPCDGAKLKIQDYPDLFSAIGSSHGRIDESFFLPDLRGRFVRGVFGAL